MNDYLTQNAKYGNHPTTPQILKVLYLDWMEDY